MINNTHELCSRGTPSGRRARRDLCAIIESVLKAIDPYELVRNNLKLKNERLTVAGKATFNLADYQHIYVVGAGKAVYDMARAAENVLGEKITCGHINIPAPPLSGRLKKITAQVARHPIPDNRGVQGAKRIKKIIAAAQADDLVLAVISGGGSALMPLPAADISLRDKIAVTSLLLKTSATIHEINIVRKHLSQIKGGQFASLAYPATLAAIYISDIIGDSLDIQASGPTAPDPSTFADARRILERHGIWRQVPAAVRDRLQKGNQGERPETPDQGHAAFCSGRLVNFTIANHQTAVSAAVQKGKELGYQTLELTSSLFGEAREVAKTLTAIGSHIQAYGRPVRRPALLVAGGETTVTIRGPGKGGRNQELVLAAMPYLKSGLTIASFGTDGVDGLTPRPVAGALADSQSLSAANQLRLDPTKYLLRNDSYHFFKKTAGHILTGPTGTNVGDLMLLAIN